jgi:hypothetical protein
MSMANEQRGEWREGEGRSGREREGHMDET